MTSPRTDRSVRKLRHSIRKRAFYIFQLTRGVPGASKEDQIKILDKTIELLNEAMEKAKEAREIVVNRDFDAYKAAKDAAAATPAPEKMAEGEVKDMTALTFADIVAKLSGDEAQAETETAKSEDQPPF